MQNAKLLISICCCLVYKPSRYISLKLICYNADLQLVYINMRLLFRPLVEKLAQIYTLIGEDYDERVLPSIASEVMKTTVVCVLLESASDILI